MPSLFVLILAFPSIVSDPSLGRRGRRGMGEGRRRGERRRGSKA